LFFAWSDVIRPDRLRRPGFFEHARHGDAKCFFTTLSRALYPWKVWGWVKIEDRIDWVRMGLFVPLALLCTQVAAALVVGFLALPGSLSQALTKPPGFASQSPWHWRGRSTLEDWLVLGAWGLADLRSEHYVQLPNPLALFHPLTTIAIGVALMMPISFVLMPATLRRARVRAGHVVRVWAYGLVALPAVVALPVFAWAIAWNVERLQSGATWSSITDWLDFNRWWLVLALAILWQVAWWAYAAGQYLRLPTPWTIGIVNTSICALVSSLLFVVLGGVEWLTFVSGFSAP
jgi:hypothetical protein